MQPTPEQCAVWWGEAYNATRNNDNWEATGHYLARLAYAAGADAELEACCRWVAGNTPLSPARDRPEDELRASRRPKPPSLKQQALESLHHLEAGAMPNIDLLRRALESLPDPQD